MAEISNKARVGDAFDLLAQGLNKMRMRVAKRIDGNSGSAVDIVRPGDIIQSHAFASLENDLGLGKSGEYVPVFLHGAFLTCNTSTGAAMRRNRANLPGMKKPPFGGSFSNGYTTKMRRIVNEIPTVRACTYP